jgi:hypothetical protein
MDTEILKMAIRARRTILRLWNPAKLHTKRYKLLCRAMGVIKADRIEMAIINPTDKNWDRV